MKAELTDNTVYRLQRLSGRPISKGVDKILNQVLDELEKKEMKNWIYFLIKKIGWENVKLSSLRTAIKP